jgi:PHD/YefM family antitoxin component YafN of YafNO toxin-antitoxin module
MGIPTVTVEGPLTVTLSVSQLEAIVNAHITETLAKHVNVHVTNVKWSIVYDYISEYSYLDGATVELQSK